MNYSQITLEALLSTASFAAGLLFWKGFGEKFAETSARKYTPSLLAATAIFLDKLVPTIIRENKARADLEFEISKFLFQKTGTSWGKEFQDELLRRVKYDPRILVDRAYAKTEESE